MNLGEAQFDWQVRKIFLNWLNLPLFLGVFLSALTSPVVACDRAKLDPSFQVAMADKIVHAVVEKITNEDTVSLSVKKYLKGNGDKNLSATQVFTIRKSRFDPCQAIVVEEGADYLFFLFDSFQGESKLRVIDSYDGVMPSKALDLEKVSELVLSNGQSSEWQTTRDGIATRLVSKKSVYKLDEEIDLELMIRNTTHKNKQINYITWPPEKHSYCELNIQNNKKKLKPVKLPTPIDYFSKFGQKQHWDLEPFHIYHFFIDRITSAKMGWGYKERLGFQYYPLFPGKFTISASCPGFFSKPLITKSIQIEVQ